jgi:enterochelin esterase-like enzyme
MRLEDILGPHEGQSRLWRQNSAYHLTREKPEALRGASIYISVGKSDDLLLGENRQYHRLLNDLGLPHEYEEPRGDHSWNLWETELPRQLNLLAEKL